MCIWLSFLLILPPLMTFAMEIQEFEFNQRSYAPTAKDNERFFPVLRSNLLLDIDVYNISRYEKFLGSLKSKQSLETKKVGIGDLREFKISKGQEISFYDSVEGKLDKTSFSSYVPVQLLENQYDDEFIYSGFSILLKPYRDRYKVYQHDFSRLDSVAYSGNRFQLTPSPLEEVSWSASTLKNEEMKIFLAHFQKKYPGLSVSLIKASVVKLKDATFFKIFTEDNSKCQVYGFKKNEAVAWTWIQEIKEGSNRLVYLGSNVASALFTAVVAVNNDYHFIIFTSKGVELFHLWSLR